MRGDADVVVSGIGLVTGLGSDRESTWSAIRANQNGIRRLAFPRSEAASRPYLGAPAAEIFAGPNVAEPIFALLDACLAEALTDALDPLAGVDHERVGVLVGLSKGCIRSLGRAVETGDGALFLNAWPNAGASFVAEKLRAFGPTSAPVAACATGLVSVLQGVELIRQGRCDVVIAGSVDASLEPILLGAFRSMRALATGEPGQAVRPWDRGRSGFAVGEGGALLVLESSKRAVERGAKPYAVVRGGAIGGDAFHETGVNPDPTNLARLIAKALRYSDTDPTSIEYVNVHGTATNGGDPAEARALRRAFGTHANRLVCSANKSQIGHLLGAAGSAELAITCLSLRDGFVPPTLNLTDPDPACDLDATPLIGRNLPVETALKLSIGFGGHLAAAVLARYPDA